MESLLNNPFISYYAIVGSAWAINTVAVYLYTKDKKDSNPFSWSYFAPAACLTWCLPAPSLKFNMTVADATKLLKLAKS